MQGRRWNVWRNRLALVVSMASGLISLLLFGAIFVDYGFVLDQHEMSFIVGVYNVAWWFYLILFTARLILARFRIERKRRVLTLCLAAALYISALPRIFPAVESFEWLSWLWSAVQSKYFLVALTGLFGVLELSRAVVDFIRKNSNPARLFVASFVVIIFVGTLLLLVPRSTMEHIRLPVIDALFVATSAVCVTGLSTVDIATTFTQEGQIIIMLLVQIGGLGVMTITSFFAMFFMGNTGFYNQLTLRDMVGGSGMSLISALLYTLGFTFMIELAGFLCIWLSIHGTMGMTLSEEFFFSLFHSVSAFCNAGFSTLTGNLGNAAIFGTTNLFYWIISFMIILGSIGFPILVNFRNALAYTLQVVWFRIFKRGARPPRYTHLVNVNSTIVLRTTTLLLVAGTVTIAILEWNGAFAGMTTAGKLTQSFFHAVVPRTAGFNSVDLTHMSFLTIMAYIFLMWVGGASQSTAGGIKVNVFAVAWANLVATVRGRNSVVLCNREISGDSVRRASAVIFGSTLSIFVFFITLVIMEPEMKPLSLLFETVSAFCTVGSSLNITPLLGADSKAVLSLAMFTGRIGLIYMLTLFVHPSSGPKYRLPKDDIIIN